MGRDIRDDMDKAGLLPAQNLSRILINGRNCEPLGDTLGLRSRAVADGDAPGTPDFMPGRDLIGRAESNLESDKTQVILSLLTLPLIPVPVGTG